MIKVLIEADAQISGVGQGILPTPLQARWLSITLKVLVGLDGRRVPRCLGVWSPCTCHSFDLLAFAVSLN